MGRFFQIFSGTLSVLVMVFAIMTLCNLSVSLGFVLILISCEWGGCAFSKVIEEY